MNNREKRILIGAAALFFLSALLSLCLGAVKLTLPQLWQAITGGPNSSSGYIFWYSRLPRTIGCLLAGGALAASGAVIQSVLRNPLASPSIIGVNAGAGLAVTACCAMGAISGWAIAGSAFLGAMAAMAMVVFLGQKTGASRTTVVLSGVAVNAILGALSEALAALFPEAAMLRADFRVGGFAAVSHARLLPAAVLILAALTALMLTGNELDVLALGDDTAKSLGLPVKRMRIFFLALAALLAGAAVSFAGLLGFVGLIVPHILRKLAGYDIKKLLPLCALGGAGFVTLCDVVSRVLFAPYELPAGILLAVIGGPVFLLLLLQPKGGTVHVGSEATNRQLSR